MNMDKPIIDDRLIKPKHWRIIIPVFIIISLVVFVLTRNTSTTYRIDRDKVIISEVINAPFQNYIKVNAIVEPGMVITIEALEGGRVESIMLEEGAVVKKGETIMKLYNQQLNMNFSDVESSYDYLTNDYKDQLLQLKQQMLSDKQSLLVQENQLGEMKRKLDKTTRLYNKGGVSEEEYLSLKNSYETSVTSGAINAEKMMIDSALRENKRRQIELKMGQVRTQLDNLNVKSPADGQLTNFSPEIGQSVSKGQSLGQIQVLTSFKLTSSIEEYYIDRVQKGLAASLEREDDTLQLEISKVYPQVTGRQFKVEFRFIDPTPDRLRVGQSYSVSLQLGKTVDAVLVPKGAFFQTTGGLWAYVLTPDEKEAVKRPIRIGKQNPQYYEVIEGLQPGEKIITSGYETFGDNERLILE